MTSRCPSPADPCGFPRLASHAALTPSGSPRPFLRWPPVAAGEQPICEALRHLRLHGPGLAVWLLVALVIPRALLRRAAELLRYRARVPDARRVLGLLALLPRIPPQRLRGGPPRSAAAVR